MKVRQAIRMLLDDGWFLVATRGSHRQYKHATKPGRVTVVPFAFGDQWCGSYFLS
jgi:predicted RNA binding protein YcfA (HicA-like mRNA interferase family)